MGIVAEQVEIWETLKLPTAPLGHDTINRADYKNHQIPAVQRKLQPPSVYQHPTTMNSEDDVIDPSDKQQHAPWLPIPSRAISVVEHPCIIKNLDKGIASLGGPVKLSKVR